LPHIDKTIQVNKSRHQCELVNIYCSTKVYTAIITYLLTYLLAKYRYSDYSVNIVSNNRNRKSDIEASLVLYRPLRGYLFILFICYIYLFIYL